MSTLFLAKNIFILSLIVLFSGPNVTDVNPNFSRGTSLNKLNSPFLNLTSISFDYSVNADNFVDNFTLNLNVRKV